eukprot:4121443-Pyramimonas_sp.AAC.1
MPGEGTRHSTEVLHRQVREGPQSFKNSTALGGLRLGFRMPDAREFLELGGQEGLRVRGRITFGTQ